MAIGGPLVLSLVLLGSHAEPACSLVEQAAAKPADAAAVKIPDTPAGRALQEFIASFNAGGEKRKAWLEGRTTVDAAATGDILEQDKTFLEEYGAMTVVRLPQASNTNIVAIVRHEKTGVHGHLTLDVQAEAPYKISNMQLRGATPEEVKGGF